MAGNNGGPWGGGGGNRGDDDRNEGRNGGRKPPEGPSQIPEIDELVRKGQEQLRVLMGGGRGPRGPLNGGGSGGNMGDGFKLTRGTVGLGVLAALALWVFSSFYTVRPEEQAVELFLGETYSIRGPGLNFAPWPLVKAEVLNVTSERTETIGSARGGQEAGLMLTTDANVVDIAFQVVWNINDPAKYLFNIRDPQQTVTAASEAVMREIIAASNLAPILNRDRGLIADTALQNVQAALDEYESGINIVRVNLERADPPREVIDSFREVQAAEQERDRLQRQADAYANTVLAEARGKAAQVLEQSEAYRAQLVNGAIGEASRFSAVLAEYTKAPDVTRKRLYIETMEKVLGGIDKTILDSALLGGEGGNGIVPYLPLNELRRTTEGN